MVANSVTVCVVDMRTVDVAKAVVLVKLVLISVNMGRMRDGAGLQGGSGFNCDSCWRYSQ